MVSLQLKAQDERQTHEEELVHAGNQDRPDKAHNPRAKRVHLSLGEREVRVREQRRGTYGHIRVVGVGHGGADLGVRRVILELKRERVNNASQC